MDLKKLIKQIFLLVIPGILYLLLMGVPLYEQQLQNYILILIPQFCIYFYILWQIFRHEEKLPPCSWFLVFALLYRLIFLLAFLIIPGLIESSIIGYGYSGQTPALLAVYLDHWPGGALFYWRIFLLLLEFAFGFLLINLIRYFGLSTYRMLILLLNPLWIIEIYRNGHDQLIGILLLWLAFSFFYLKKDWLALPAVVLSFFVSMVPIFSYLPYLYKKFWPKVFLTLTGVALGVYLCSISGIIPAYHFLLASGREAFNGPLLSAGIYLLKYFNLSGAEVITINWFGNAAADYTRAEFYILLVIALIVLAVIIAQIKKLQLTANFRSINYLQSSFIITGTLLLVSPVLHPWHLLWILPFIIFLPNWSWLVFTVLIQLSYLFWTDYLFTSNWMSLVIYVPFYLMLITEYLDKRRIKGWF
jgi:hypothetical protein